MQSPEPNRVGGGGGNHVSKKIGVISNKLRSTVKRNMTTTTSALKTKVVLKRVVFSEEYIGKMRIYDPQGVVIHRWNKILLVSCLISLFIDPLFFYLPQAREQMCISIEMRLEVALMFIRSIGDVFYMIQIFMRFRTAYVSPSSRVFGRGELVIDPSKIASRYLQKDFWIDLLAAIPLPQVFIWVVIPNLRGFTMTDTKNILRLSIIFQYLPRLFLIFPLSTQIVNATGVVMETAWAGAAYNLMLYMLASHVLGACWYLLSVERQEACWREVCSLESLYCRNEFFDCHGVEKSSPRVSWFKLSNITNLCDPTNDIYSFQFGIYADALSFHVTSSTFISKYFYCMWWGLRNLSSLGQNLSTSTYVGEISFAIIIAIVGLVLFALLIGNMQTYLQSTTARLEEWRIRRRDTEQWMRHRQLPQELRQCIRRYDQYKWVAKRGVDEEALLKELPKDLQRDIKRHLCLDLVRRVPLFDEMDERMLDALCERLRPALCTQGTCLVREGDPVSEMLFIIRGHLDSHTTNGGRTGFFNLCRIGPGDFCGEELLTWALDPRPNIVLPLSTRTVEAIGEVEAFALSADDITFVSSQFRRLHSKHLRHKFRFYSHQWRTWAACILQVAWRRFKKKKEVSSSSRQPTTLLQPPSSPAADAILSTHGSPRQEGQNQYATTRLLAPSTRSCKVTFESDSGVLRSLQKPDEPDFL